MIVEEGQTEKRDLIAKIIFQGTSEKSRTRVVLDFGDEPAASYNQIILKLKGDNFRCNVKAEGSKDQKQWWLLTDKGMVYRHEGKFEQTSFTIPQSNYRYLRVTLSKLQGEIPQLEGARVEATVIIPRKLVAVSARLTRKEDARNRKTILELDTGKLDRDFAEALFDIQEPLLFRREVTVEVANPCASLADNSENAFLSVTRGVLERPVAGKKVILPLNLPQGRCLRISIFNGDDHPLTIKKVTLFRLRRGLLFEAAPAAHYQLWYGRRDAPAPEYDIQHLFLAVSPSILPIAALGPQKTLPVKPPPPPPWSERHQILFWIVLLLVLGILAVFVVRSLRPVSGKSSKNP
jgi:hypothetical protein